MRPALLGLMLLCSCGIISGNAHCDFDSQNRCQERLTTTMAEAFKATCSASQGKAGDGPCPTADRVGGCDLGKQGDGTQTHDWYYAPKTRADAMSSCGSGETFLEP